jgi:hypothetical protein
MVALATGKPQHNVVMGLRGDNGSITWISINSEPIFSGTNTEPTSVVTSFSGLQRVSKLKSALRPETPYYYRSIFHHYLFNFSSLTDDNVPQSLPVGGLH